MEEEEYKSNALSQTRVSLGGGNGLYSSQRSQPVSDCEESKGLNINRCQKEEDNWKEDFQLQEKLKLQIVILDQ